MDAVNATSGQIITHPQAPDSTVIIAYYSSSSGGHTDSNVDGFGHSTLLPYLQGVDDPWSIDPIAQNPLASWSKKVNAVFVHSDHGRLDADSAGARVKDERAFVSEARTNVRSGCGAHLSKFVSTGRGERATARTQQLAGYWMIGNPHRHGG